MALEMRERCEATLPVSSGSAAQNTARCDASLTWDADATICSHECTFCRSCADDMNSICPNCGGDLQTRPRRKVSA